jgi:ferritin-like metal-binding protein YciE
MTELVRFRSFLSKAGRTQFYHHSGKTLIMKTRHTAATTARRTATKTSSPGREVRDEIIDWLRDAYAMERGLEGALEKQSKNEDLSREFRDRAAQHLEETRRHAEDVKSALQSLGADTSALKTGMGVVAQATKGLGTKFTRDERIKDLLDAYSMEHFEIACYMALATAAERAGLAQVAAVCNRILPDEERMADTLLDYLPAEITNYLFERQAEAS